MSTSEKVNIAVIGCGRVAKTHLNAITQLKEIFSLAAVVDIDENRAKTYANMFSTKYYFSLNQLYNDTDIEAVVICLPHNLHRPVGVDCLQAGKHVLVEKPMARDFTESIEMVEAAAKSGKILMVGQSRRFFDACRIIKEKLPELGSYYSLLYHWGSGFNQDAAPSWWKSKDSTGGLIIPMSGSHAIDQVIWYYGFKPKTVYAKIYNCKDFWEGSSDASIILDFGENRIATLRLSLTTKPVIHQIIINGPNGTLLMNHQEQSDKVGVGYLELYLNGETITKGFQEPSNFYYQAKEFGMAIKEERQPICSGQEILVNMQVLDAINESAMTGKIVTLD